MASVSDIIARIDDKIYDLINDTGNITSYSIGGKSVNKTEALNALRALRETYQKLELETPYENIEHIALDLDRFGADESEYIGDSTVV